MFSTKHNSETPEAVSDSIERGKQFFHRGGYKNDMGMGREPECSMPPPITPDHPERHRPAVIQAMLGAIIRLDHMCSVDMVAGAPASVLEELSKARENVYAQHKTFYAGGPLFQHLLEHKLCDPAGFDPLLVAKAAYPHSKLDRLPPGMFLPGGALAHRVDRKTQRPRLCF